ncbi:uncharacterized protein LOC112005329 [Quercus suber]|uniref:uncharacterized protein LOC112005329 n=1 Tax=Quercus suber TaxID=58331 RepID=UPI000CE2895D|nr:uncharacterized protein LOC112005329 [Quercus suber]
MGSNPSYAWRSIHNSLGILKEGTRWRVGNGRRIHIWDDRWLPTPTTFKVISPPVEFGNFPMVASLIDEDTKWWKSDLVRSIFLPFEADSILKIPISYNLPDDQLIWLGNKRGSFSVKSASYIAMRIAEANCMGESITVHSQPPFWKKIWHLNVPPKVWIFAWRVCNNGLPTMLALRCRGLNSSGFCPLCDKELESIQHALFLCPHAKCTWATWLDCPLNLTSINDDIMNIAAKFIDLGKLHDLDLFFMVAWSIWGNRNQAFHNDATIPPSQVWESARRALFDFNAARQDHLPPLSHASLLWATPPPGFHKINVDGAMDEGVGCSGIGVIIRDSSGAVIGALSKVLPVSLNAEVTEAFALLNGVLFALELQISQAIFESDALSIILALSSHESGGELGHILEDIMSASCSFSHCTFHHLKRDGNKAAHSLAREAKLFGQTKVWKGTPPQCLLQILRDDMLSSLPFLGSAH